MPRDLHYEDGLDEDDYGVDDDSDDVEDGDEDLDEADVDQEAQDFYGEFARPMTPEDTVDLLAAAGAERGGWIDSNGRIHLLGEMTCRVCGCSDTRACQGGCFWAAPNLCSRCAA